MALQLEKMSYRELISLQEKIANAVAEKKIIEKANVKQQIAELAAKSGFDLDEIVGKQNGKGSKVAVKYRHPKDKALTWTGRGRKPTWLVAELDKGLKLDSFLVL